MTLNPPGEHIVREDDLTPSHLEWLVKSRARNQHSALELFKLFAKYPALMKSKELSPTSQNLVAVCFSLWRAAFLADKTGTRHAVFEHARKFLGKMLIDNAITYPQDRSAREWTFNYYMNNAKDGLLHLSTNWPIVASILSEKKAVVRGTTAPQRRWNRHQQAFETAAACLKRDLEKRNLI
jgi:hypothetical protein